MANRKFTTLPYTEYPVADGHYDETRLSITKIVLHSSASNKQGLIDTFGGGTRMVSAHYGIDNQGNLMAFLEEKYTAFAVGLYSANQSTLSVEHIDEGATVKLHTDAQYAMSAKLVKDICAFYNIPIDAAHIIPHSSVVATACPNGLDVARVISEANGAQPPVDECPAKLLSITAERDRLNGVITHKDELLQSLQDSIGAKNSQISGLENEKKQLADTLGLCQNSSASYLEIAKKVPEMEKLLKEQESSLQSLKEERTNLQKTIGAYKGRWELMKWSLKRLIVEKIIPMI